jgi:hypothetical protein
MPHSRGPACRGTCRRTTPYDPPNHVTPLPESPCSPADSEIKPRKRPLRRAAIPDHTFLTHHSRIWVPKIPYCALATSDDGRLASSSHATARAVHTSRGVTARRAAALRQSHRPRGADPCPAKLQPGRPSVRRRRVRIGRAIPLCLALEPARCAHLCTEFSEFDPRPAAAVRIVASWSLSSGVARSLSGPARHRFSL